VSGPEERVQIGLWFFCVQSAGAQPDEALWGMGPALIMANYRQPVCVLYIAVVPVSLYIAATC